MVFDSLGFFSSSKFPVFTLNFQGKHFTFKVNKGVIQLKRKYHNGVNFHLLEWVRQSSGFVLWKEERNKQTLPHVGTSDADNKEKIECVLSIEQNMADCRICASETIRFPWTLQFRLFSNKKWQSNHLAWELMIVSLVRRSADNLRCVFVFCFEWNSRESSAERRESWRVERLADWENVGFLWQIVNIKLWIVRPLRKQTQRNKNKSTFDVFFCLFIWAIIGTP